MKRTLIIIAILLLPATPIVLVVTGVLKNKSATVKPVALTVWGTAGDEKAVAALTARYRQTHSYVSITYTQLPTQDYSQQLISAWAQGTGPDIFFTPSNWIGQMSQYAVPMPANISVPQLIISKGLIGLGTSTKVVTSAQAAPAISVLKNSFVEAATDDVIQNNQVWGLPLSMDTIVTYYNKALTNNAKIFEPATTWSQLQSQLTSNKLTVTDDQGKLVQSGVALGTSGNVPYSPDILSLLMMQNGSLMTTPDKQAKINDDAGLQAIKFYLSFAQPDKNNYSWDASQTNARDAFIQGKLGYFFGTLADRAAIEASGVNWDVSPMLHIRDTGDNDGPTAKERFIDTAEYSVAMVSRASAQSGRATQAWNYVNFISQAANVPAYLNVTGQLPAQKSLLSKYSTDVNLGVYAKQLLTAKSWYHGNNGVAVNQYLGQLIDSGLIGKTALTDLLDLTNSQIQSTL